MKRASSTKMEVNIPWLREFPGLSTMFGGSVVGAGTADIGQLRRQVIYDRRG